MTNPYSVGVYPNQIESYQQVQSPQSIQTQDYSQYSQYPQMQDLSQYQQMYYPQVTRPKTPSIMGSALVGLLGGGTIGYLKYRRPVSKDGTVSDSFAKQAFNDYAKKGPNKKYFKEANELLSKLDKVKSPAEFKKLISKHKEICNKNYLGISFDTVYDTVNKDNFNSKVSNLKNAIQSTLNHDVNNMKDTILACWDKENKKFVKPSSLRNNKIFDSIVKTKSNIQWKKAGKYGGITAGILGGLALVYRIIVAKLSGN